MKYSLQFCKSSLFFKLNALAKGIDLHSRYIREINFNLITQGNYFCFYAPCALPSAQSFPWVLILKLVIICIDFVLLTTAFFLVIKL